jgi:hypothetical protein
MSLAEARIQRFLATKDIVILATLRGDGGPREADVVPPRSGNTDHHQSRRYPEGPQRTAQPARVRGGRGRGRRWNIRGVTVQWRAELLSDDPERRALIERFHEREVSWP